MYRLPILRKEVPNETEESPKLFHPMGIYFIRGGFCRGHGKSLGFSRKNGCPRRQRVSVCLPYICGTVQHRRPCCRICCGTSLPHRHTGLLSRSMGCPEKRFSERRRLSRLASAGRICMHRSGLRCDHRLCTQSPFSVPYGRTDAK